ncbi:hypothetical protein HBH53_258760 [Parastagonospora nodorum]|nr:hypothetical protein HBH53_258760 [Parastagonospora nodorum]
MCAKDDLVGRKGPLLTSTQTWEVLPNHVDTFGSDFAFSFAAWLQRIKCTLGDVDSLFADEDIAKTSGLSGLEADQHFFVYQNILSLIAFIISYRNTDYPVRVYYELYSGDWWWNIQQSLLDGATVVLIIILVDKTQLSLISGDVAAWLVYVTIGNLTTISACTVEHCCSLSNIALENAAKSGILLACADGRTRQCYLTICAILADYEEQVLLTGVKKNRYCTRCTRCLDKGHDDFVHPVDCFGWKHYNFNIHVSLATDTLHLLLKGLVMKMLDFMQDMLDDIYPGSRKTWDNSTTLVTQESGSTQLNERFCQVMHSTGLKRFNNKRAFTEAIIQQLVAVVSPLFVSKAPFALHFIRAVCDLVTLAQYKRALERMNVFKEEFRVYRRTLGEEKNFNYPKWHALTHIIQDICMYGALDGICTGANSEAYHITMKEYILQICLHNSRRTALLAADYATVVKQSRPSTTIHPSIKCWRSSGKRHNDPEHCDEEVVRCAPNWQQTGLWRRDYVWLYLILTIIDYTCYDKDGKYMAYIGAFSEVLLFNNNGQIDNTTGMLSVPFKFYDLSMIICLVHLVLRDLPDLTTRTTMSYYVNNYIDWDEYNCLYLPTFDIDLLRTLREY